MTEEIIKTEGEVIIPPKLEVSDELPGIIEDTPTATETPIETTEEATVEPYAKFDTQEDLEAFLAEQIAQQTPIEDLPTDEQGDTIFPPDWKPNDWNHFAQEFRKKVVPFVENDIQAKQEAQRKHFEVLNQRFDREYTEVAKKYNLPALNTPEGQEINKQITTLGAKYNQESITNSAELWKSIPKENGGGMDYTPTKKENPSKKASAMIGGSSSASTTSAKSNTTYEKLHKTDIDTLIDQALENGS